MLQLSKILKSRNEWRDKAKKRTKEIWEMRKVHKYYQEIAPSNSNKNPRKPAKIH
jgi:hypothetical protein